MRTHFMPSRLLSRTLAAMLVAVWLVLPAVLARQYVDLLVFSGIFTIGGLGVALLLGQCGIVNIAQAVFYGVGAYASAYCTTTLGWPIWSGFLIGASISALLALAIGWPVLKLTGFFLALATLAVGSIAGVLFFEWDGITGGTLGLSGIPKIQLFGLALDTPTRFYYFVWAIAAACLWLGGNLVRGRPGLAMRAMRDAPAAAEGLAVDIHRLQVSMFVICAILGAVAGSLFAHYVSFVSVQSFTIERSVLFLLIPVIAGARSVWGVIFGALFVTFVPEFLSKLGDIHQVLFGLALVVVVTLLPEGIIGSITARLRSARRPA